jgi:hypothetical protein
MRDIQREGGGMRDIQGKGGMRDIQKEWRRNEGHPTRAGDKIWDNHREKIKRGKKVDKAILYCILRQFIEQRNLS